MAVSNNPAHMFAAPIPGAGLTKTPNSAPWQAPAQFTDMHKALTFTWNVILKDTDTVMQIVTFLKHGVAIVEIVNTFLFAGVAGGKWSLDLALLMYQTFAHQIETVARMHGVKDYTFKRINPKTSQFMQEYKQYLQEPLTQPVKQEATKSLIATGLGLDKGTK